MYLNLLLAVLLHLFHTEDKEEREKVKRAEECCKKILNHVNQAVKEAENKQVELAVVGVFHFSAGQHFNELCVFCPKETARLSETAGHLVTQAGRPPHDPGAEGKKHLLHRTQENPVVIAVLVVQRAHSALT